jgi:hypothetical protein
MSVSFVVFKMHVKGGGPGGAGLWAMLKTCTVGGILFNHRYTHTHSRSRF